MKDQELNILLQAIENKTFIGTKLAISAETFDGERIEEGLNDEQVTLLVNALKNNPCITEMDLSCNSIGDNGAIALASINNLEELNLYENNIGPIGAKALAESALKKLSLEANLIQFDEETFEQFLEMINAFICNKTIIDLNLNDCYCPDMMIAQLIMNNTTIKKLVLSRYLTDEALQFIENNTTLQNLYLPENQITDQGAGYISRNTSLKELSIDSSKITNVGAGFLSVHPTLQKLYLYDSEITIEGAQFFIGKNLENIVLKYNLKHPMTNKELYDFYFAFEEGKNIRQNTEIEFICSNEEVKDINLSGDIDY